MNATDLERLAAFSDRIRDSTLKRLKRVPAGKENVRFPSGAMSCADIADHLAHSDEIFLDLPETRYRGKDLGRRGQSTAADRDAYESLIDKLEVLKARRRNFILAQDDSTLAVQVEFDALDGSGEMDLGSMIYRQLDHEIHHRGALAVYLRAFESGD